MNVILCCTAVIQRRHGDYLEYTLDLFCFLSRRNGIDGFKSAIIKREMDSLEYHKTPIFIPSHNKVVEGI